MDRQMEGLEVMRRATPSGTSCRVFQAFEKFERAFFKTQQKADESTMSFVNRLAVAFHEHHPEGDPGLHPFEAELPDIGGQTQSDHAGWRRRVEANKVEAAMRALSTRILASSSEGKKKIFPVSYVDTDETSEDVMMAEKDMDEDLAFYQMAEQGDEDAIFVTEYEDNIVEWVQEQPELASCLSAYNAAWLRLRDKAKTEQCAWIVNRLEELCVYCQDEVDKLKREALSPPINLSCRPGNRTFVEILVRGSVAIGISVQRFGGEYWQVRIPRQGLLSADQRARIEKMLKVRQPRHAWVTSTLKDFGPSEKVAVQGIGKEVYFEQVTRQDHFHVLVEGSDGMQGQGWDETSQGTIPTTYDATTVKSR